MKSWFEDIDTFLMAADKLGGGPVRFGAQAFQ